MIPFIHTAYGDIPTFIICATAGILGLFIYLHIILRFSEDRDTEEAYIFPKIVISGMAGLATAALFDAIFKYIKYGYFQIRGITFYGGLIGAVLTIFILLSVPFPTSSRLSRAEWFEIITPGFIIFHIFGRIGCFFAGCCYGKATDGPLGIVFPDNSEHHIYHNGEACYPTQLFEAFALILILFIVIYSKEKFITYLLLYSVCRFSLEFLRGDDRGSTATVLSPAQCISVGIFLCGIVLSFRRKTVLKRQKHQHPTAS